MGDLYDDDILLWSERQSDLRRRIAAGEPVNERPDWMNIIEEVESVGRSDLRAVESLLLQAFMPMLKAEAWPNALSVPAWQSDALLFRAHDVDELYTDAVRALPTSMDGQPPQPVSRTCPM